MEYRILGPVEAIDGDRRVELGGPLERALLARLLVAAGRVVSLDLLIDDLWPGEAPDSANVSVRVRISRLRKALAGAERIRTRQPGYVLELGAEDSLDLARFEQLAEAGRAALREADAETASRLLREALGLWRGTALAGVGDAPFARAEAARLEEARIDTLEDRIDADLALGRHSALIGELESLCAQHPLSERFWAQRMTALYRSGRQADALAVFQDLRRTLSGDLGLDPSPELAALEAQILAQAPELSGPGRAPVAIVVNEDGLPTGVVTFLLTDIERSSELWEGDSSVMSSALERHDGLIAEVVEAHGGRLIKSKGEGDSTLSVFRRATDGAAAAMELSESLSQEHWPGGMDLRVRMALHTGEAHERGGDYYGPAVNRAARLRSLASGGQLVLSRVTAELVRDHLPDDAALVDLGEHELRGLARAEYVFELLPGRVESLRVPGAQLPLSRPTLPEAVVPAIGSQFVGREPELDRLGALLKEVSAGGLRAVFAAGEPGIGKTRLCAEFAQFAYGEGAVVLYGRSDEEPLVPYQPFVEALRHWTSALSPRERTALSGADYLAPLITELAATARPVPVEDPEVARYKFFEAVASALDHAMMAGPLVLLLDDLHWADRPTLQLLQHILRTRSSSRMLLIGTYRETDLTRTRPLAEALADFRRERAFERIALDGLGEDEIFVLLEGAATHEIGGAGRALARALSQTTEGNPFFIEQILGNLVETGRLARREDRWVLETRIEELGIPEGVVEAIGRRLSRLSDTCNKALAAASVLGRDFEVDILMRVLASDPDEVLAAIEEALDVGLVRELPTRGHPSCSFSHALVQQALYEELSLARKQRIHLKAAAAIEAAHVTDIEPYITALARHMREAGAAADPEKAIDYSIRAMEAAARVSAFEEGIAHGEAALELIDEYAAGESHRARLHERLGDMRYVAGVEYERSFAHYETALHAYARAEEAMQAARVHIKFGRGLATYLETLDIPRALEQLRTAEQTIESSPDPRLIGPLALGLAAASMYGRDIEAGAEAARHAMLIGRQQGNEAIWATGAALEAWALLVSGRLEDADRLLDEAWAVADRLDNVLAAFAASWIRGVCYQRDPREVWRLSARELDKPRQAQATTARRSLEVMAGGALAMAGAMSEARPLVTERSELSPYFGFGARYFAESFEEAETFARRKLSEIEAQGNKFVVVPSLTAWLGAMQAARGATDLARRSFEESLELAAGKGLSDLYENHARLAMLGAYDGRVAEGEEHIARCEEILALGNGWGGYLGYVAMARGAVRASGGNGGEAGFTEAIDIFNRYGLPFEEAEAQVLWGRALASADPKRAVEKFDAALEIYTSRGIGKAWIERALAERKRAG